MSTLPYTAPSVLLVEDDEEVRTVLSSAIEQAGYELDMARNCDEAERAIAERSHDVMVTDIRLPDGLGYDLVAHARAAGCKVIFITGYFSEMPTVQGQRTSCLIKPFPMDELIQEIREQVGSGAD